MDDGRKGSKDKKHKIGKDTMKSFAFPPIFYSKFILLLIYSKVIGFLKLGQEGTIAPYADQ
jgi:hypothetical protein